MQEEREGPGMFVVGCPVAVALLIAFIVVIVLMFVLFSADLGSGAILGG